MKIEQLPDKSFSLKKMQIINNLIEKTDKRTVLGLSIVNAINEKQPVKEILDYIKDCANDNYFMVAQTIGYDLIEEISNI